MSEVVFKNTLAGLVALLGPEVRTPALEARLTELGLSLAVPPAQKAVSPVATITGAKAGAATIDMVLVCTQPIGLVTVTV